MDNCRSISRRSLDLPCIWATAYLHLQLFLEWVFPRNLVAFCVRTLIGPPRKKMADRRRKEGGRAVVQIHRSKVPYLYALSIPLFSGYLPMIQCSICCIPCSDVVCFHGVRMGKLSEVRVFWNLDSWRRLSLCLDTVLSFISYYFSYMFSTPVRDLKSGKFWKKCSV